MSNSFYTHGSFPSTGSAATSATMRNELDLVTQGFDKLPTLGGAYANQVVVLSATGLAIASSASLNGISIGGTTAAAGAFTTLSASGTTTLSGLTASTALALDASKNVVSVTNTGTGSNVLATSPTLVTPALGTPSSATLTNATGLPISTGVSGLGTGVATFLATPSSANLASAVTDETGSGALVFATSPTLVTPALGTPSSATLTNATGLPISTGVSGLGTGVATALAVNVGTAGSPVVNGGVLGTPSSGTLTNATGLPISTGVSGLGTGVATFLATPSSANLASAVTDETGTGALVFATSPTLVTPALGTPSALVGTNITGTATSFNINGTVGATTPSTGSFTSLDYSTTLTGGTGIVNLGSGQFYKDASGNVGIGNTSPAALLHVGTLNGTGSLNGYTKLAVEGTDYSVITLKSPAANFNQIIFTDTTTTSLGGINYFNSTNATPNAMAFLTAGSEQMRINSSGNLTLGTPSSWDAQARLEMVGNLSIDLNSNTATSSLMDAGVQNNMLMLRAPFNSSPATTNNNGAKWGIGFYGGPPSDRGSYAYVAQGQFTRGAGIYAVSEDTGAGYNRRVGLAFHTTSLDQQTAERVRIDSDGNVGIGTSSPATKLDVSGSATASNFLLNVSAATFGKTSDTSIEMATSADATPRILFRVGSASELMRIDSSGNVLVGTSGAIGKLGVVTPTSGYGFALQGRSTDGQSIMSSMDRSGTVYTGNFTFPEDGSILFGRLNTGTNTERMRIDSSGNVGIGTSSPSTYANGFGPVLVTGTGNNFATIQGRTDGPTGATNGVSYGGSYSTNPINGARITLNAEGGSGQKGSVSFWTKALDDNSTQPLERMRIDSSGNLGIGTSSPAYRLDVGTGSVSGNIHTYGSITSGTLAGYSIRSIPRLTNDTGTFENTYIGCGASVGNIIFQQGNSFTAASNTERMRIDSSGRLLVGATSARTTEAKIELTSAANTALSLYMFKDTQVEATLGFKSSTDSNFYIGSGSTSVGTNGVYLTNTGNSWNSVSDERMKTILEPITNAAEKVASLRTVIGYYNNDEKQTRRPFLIAQDVQAVLPEAVNVQDQDTGTLGMSYTDTIPLLVAAIQEQQVLITSLTARIAALEST